MNADKIGAMTKRVFLGGGGSAEQESALWSEAFRPGARVAVLPYAHAAKKDREATVAWIRGALAPYEPRSIVSLGAPEVADSGFSDIDVLCIPGGNAFTLLRELRSTGLLGQLTAYLEGGGHLYGGSAGAILAGTDISIAATTDLNDVGLSETRGLDLLNGMDVLPHYTAAMRKHAQSHAQSTGRRVLALPESSGVVVSEGRVRNAGPDPVEIIGHEPLRVLAAGEEWVFLTHT